MCPLFPLFLLFLLFLRHLLRGKADIRYIQELLGHADLDTTKHYLRLVPGHLREDYDAAMPDIATGLAVAPHALQDI